jgi:AmiR/NasT family two-component response regulator
MGNDHHPRDTASTRIDLHAVHTIAIAQGILVERLRTSAGRALDILDQHAQHAGIPIVEAANWLIATGTLPSAN